jgi:uncharacterized membrane protein YbjE (DUF340 family)
MLLLLAALGCGLLIGSRGWLPERARAWTSRCVNGTLLLLLFCVGAEIGSQEQVLHHLGRFGLAAALLAVAATAASAGAAWAWARWLVPREHTTGVLPDSGHADSQQ